MKGKLRILGSMGLALLLVCALMLAAVPAAKVEASSSVSSVWMEFLAAGNNVDTNAQYTIHFTTGSALSRGVDTITVLFPDGVDTTMGPITTQDNYDFELGAAVTTASNYSVDPDGAGTTYGYTACTADATAAGYRVKVTTPVDIPATTAAYLKIATGANIDTPHVAATAAYPYKIQLATSQDTSFVLSSAFSVDDSLITTVVTTDPDYPSSLIAGANAAYRFKFDPVTAVGTGVNDWVTIQFPVGTTFTSSTIATTNVYVGNDWEATGSDPHAKAVTVDTNARTVTARPGESTGEAATAYIFITIAAGIENPTSVGATTVKFNMWTSNDGRKVEGTGVQLVADAATQLVFRPTTSSTDASDNATIINAFTGELKLEAQDVNGNVDLTDSTTTVLVSVTTGTGTVHTAAGSSNPWGTSQTLGNGKDDVFYFPTTAGTHVLTATKVTGAVLTAGSFTVYVAPAVVLKDTNGNEIGTYKPVVTDWSTTVGGTYIQQAIDAAFPGDTVELGGTADDPAIYELSTALTLDKAITLTSATSALYTTLRPTADTIRAINIGIDGSSTNPITISGFTFDRLRADYEFHAGVMNNGYDFVTVSNNTFNYIIPDQNTSAEAVVWTRSIAGNITSSTVSDNIFNNCVGFNAISGRAGSIVFDLDSCGNNTMSGVTISGNELTNCNDYGIQIRGNNVSQVKPTVVITNNIITNGYSSLNLSDFIASATITGNTITGGYNYGISVEGTHNTTVTIKNNTITGSVGPGIRTYEVADVVTIQFNDISGNGTYGIQSAALTVTTESQDCRYNYFGDASGPDYTALSGATITTSNTAGTGDKITDDVTYYPWLYKSRADVVTDNANYCAQRISLAVGIHTLSTPALLITTANTIPLLMPDYATLYDGKPKMEYCYKYDNGIWSNIGTDTLTPCHAYYIKMTVADSVVLQYAADQYDTPSWLLDEGWNLISLANLSSKQVDEAVASVLKDSAGLPGYSQVISPSMNASPWSYSAGASGNGINMLVGEGYWIYMQNDATLAGFTIFPLVPDLD